MTGSNCFPHNRRPAEILEAARYLLKPGGSLCLEVMYAGALLNGLQWDSLYQEHATVYSLANLKVLARRFGFYLADAARMDIHGGSLRARFVFQDKVPSESACRISYDEYESGLNDYRKWIDFGKRAKRQIDLVGDVVGQLIKLQAYGASARSTMWLNACGFYHFGFHRLSAVADESSSRIGLHVPCTAQEIVHPDRLRELNPRYIFITAWNYAADIIEKESWFDGTWIVPLPELRFIPGRAAK